MDIIEIDFFLGFPERQYDMLNSLLGRKFVPPMYEVLADDGSEKAIVDLGSGSGNWSVYFSISTGA